ncbi:MAG: hypothetical protein AAF787_14090 [Chloroflexota bacterium]
MAKKQRKSMEEARAEQITWFLLVLIFAVLSITQDNVGAITIPNWVVPMAGGIVLMGSGIYQYTRGWRVSPTTWIIGVILIIFGGINFQQPELNLIGFSLLAFAAVIFFGLVTNET